MMLGVWFKVACLSELEVCELGVDVSEFCEEFPSGFFADEEVFVIGFLVFVPCCIRDGEHESGCDEVV